MPLTHVCRWTKHGWKKITALEAHMLHPGGTVSARSGLFMCALCHQNVEFTNGRIRDRYFRHSSAEQDKNCEDRTFSDSGSYSFRISERELPLKLKTLSQKNFELYVGLPPLPEAVLEKFSRHKIIISSPNNRDYVYSFERISSDRINYLYVGNIPCRQYSVTINPNNIGLSSFWPKSSGVIFSEGTLFDGITGKKLPYDSDVVAGHDYYLLTQRPVYKKYARLICETSAPHWYIYDVCTNFDEDAATFFLNYHCILTENPADIIPVWPVYVRKPYLLYHLSDKVSFFLKGDAKLDVYPSAGIDPDGNPDGKVFTVNCNGRQQIIAAGRMKVLKYVYLWKDSLNYQAEIPKVSVTDSAGEILQSGEQNKLPKNRSIRVKTPFDGYALKVKDRLILERYEIPAGKITEINGINTGHCVEVYQGLDIVWQVHYVRADSEADDDKLYDALRKCRDDYTVISHSAGALSARMNDYPKAKNFLYACIRNGRISRKAYNILIHRFAK